MNTSKEAPMGKEAPMYIYATENVAKYYELIGCKNKRVLTVCGSGDQVINAYFFGARKVTCFDLSKYAEYITKLKIAAIQILTYDEFFDFFGKDEVNIGFDYKIYLKIRPELNKKTKTFFDFIYKKYNRIGKNVARSEYFRKRNGFSKGSILRFNGYLRNKKEYSKAKDILKGKEINFIRSDAKELNLSIASERFDIINLSNISGYIVGDLVKNGSNNPIKELLDCLLIKLKRILSRKGIILLYVYSRKGYPNPVVQTKAPIIADPKTPKLISELSNFKVTVKRLKGYGHSMLDKIIVLSK
jgi:hypothetical protein